MRAVLLMAGGTGGHVMPALALARALRRREVPVFWLGTTQGLEARLVPAAGIPLDTLPVQGLRGKGWRRWLGAPLLVWRAMRAARAVLRKRQPAVVVGFGGYVAGPGALAARLAGLPLVLHEQNARPGLTNRVLQPLARLKFCGFSGWPGAQWVGNPVRDEILALPEPEVRYAGRADGLRVLVFGGSQGARFLNEQAPAALAQLAQRLRLEIRHQAGRGQAEEVRARYQAQGLAAEVSEFIDDMAEAYAWADLAICRSGALTLAELAAAGLPAILVPFPHAVDDHQTANARVFAEAGAAVLLPQAGLDAAGLAQAIRDLADRARLLAMARRARGLARPDAAEVMAGQIVGLMGEQG